MPGLRNALAPELPISNGVVPSWSEQPPVYCASSPPEPQAPFSPVCILDEPVLPALSNPRAGQQALAAALANLIQEQANHRGRRLMAADFKQALRAGLLAFAGIALGGFVLIALWSPTVSPCRMAAFVACMFALSGGIVAAVVVGVLGRRRE